MERFGKEEIEFQCNARLLTGTAKLGSTTVEYLIDCGSEIDLVSADTARKLKLHYDSERYNTIVLGDGNRSRTLGTINRSLSFLSFPIS